jgi:hypothetical protein
MATDKQVVFSLDEVNQILQVLGEVPARYSLDLITFIRGKAQEQIGDKDEPITDVEVVA